MIYFEGSDSAPPNPYPLKALPLDLVLHYIVEGHLDSGVSRLVLNSIADLQGVE